MNTRRLTPILAGLICTCAALTGCRTISENQVDDRRIAPERAWEMIDRNPSRFLVLDARTPEAFQEGRIPGARRMELAEFDPQDPDPAFKAYRGVIIYGDDPRYGRANALTKRFLEADIRVFMIDGGMMAWQSKGLPVEKGDRP
jgi:rhodanese-related sulfurtransferase